MRSKLLRNIALVSCLSLCLFATTSCRSSGTGTSAATKVGKALVGAIPYAVGLYVATAVGNSLPESRGVMIASQPVGARVLINGKDSGFATPCCLDIVRRKQRIDLVLDGYQQATRIVTDDNRTYLIYWREAYVGPKTYHFPTFLNLYDGWVPVRFEETYSPERLFVHLRPAVTP